LDALSYHEHADVADALGLHELRAGGFTTMKLAQIDLGVHIDITAAPARD
jgi:hypothetical protein